MPEGLQVPARGTILDSIGHAQHYLFNARASWLICQALDIFDEGSGQRYQRAESSAISATSYPEWSA